MFSPALTPLTAAANAPAFVLVCVACGFLAALVMDIPMSQEEDGFVPAYVAAAIVRRVPPAAVTFAQGAVAHHAAGALAGGLYAGCYLALSAALPGTVAVGGVDLLPHVLSTAAVAAFVYAFFAHVVLPRAGRRIYEERATAVRGQWLRSSVVFGAVIGVIVPAFATVV
ncbi:hypothetical protein [Halobellus sp. GM3]|uniref:hypothetical protein n=1 Tax=Halobellus sp. GM3 TaxID=3458410 RepID=UPI00403DEED1